MTAPQSRMLCIEQRGRWVPEYQVTIKETVYKVIQVEADDEDDALSKYAATYDSVVFEEVDQIEIVRVAKI